MKTVNILSPHACDTALMSVKRLHFVKCCFVNHRIHQHSRCLKRYSSCSAQSVAKYCMYDTPNMVVMNCATHNAEIPFGSSVECFVCGLCCCAVILYCVCTTMLKHNMHVVTYCKALRKCSLYCDRDSTSSFCFTMFLIWFIQLWVILKKNNKWQ